MPADVNLQPNAAMVSAAERPTTTEGVSAQLARMEQKIDAMCETMVPASRSPASSLASGSPWPGSSEPLKSGFSELDQFINISTAHRDKLRTRFGVEVYPTVPAEALGGGFEIDAQPVAVFDPVVVPITDHDVKRSPASPPPQSPGAGAPVGKTLTGPSRMPESEQKNLIESTLYRFGLSMPAMPVEPERTDIFAQVALSSQFNKFFFLVIILNIAASIHQANNAASTLGDKGEWASISENTFAILFLIEIVVKLACHRCYFFINEEWHWNTFDFLVVFVSIADVLALHLGPGQLGPAMRAWRLLRVCKVFRIFRAFKFLSELRIMVACLTSSIMPLMWCTVMIALIILVAALLFIDLVTQSRIENPEAWKDDALAEFVKADFTSVHGAMLALFQSTTGGRDWGELYVMLGTTGILAKIIFMMYVLFFIFAFFNIITSIFVDRVMREAQPDHEELMMKKRHDDHKAAVELKKLISSLNSDGNTSISAEEFLELHNHPEVAIQFDMAGLNIYDVHSFFKTCCSISGTDEIEIDTFVEYAFQMKGVASSVDVQTILFEVRDMSKAFKKLKSQIGDVE